MKAFLCIFLPLLLTSSMIACAFTMERILPENASAGSSITVRLIMDVDEEASPQAIGLTEAYPAAWTPTEVSHGGRVRSDGQIEWIFFSLLGTAPIDQEITYGLQVPDDAEGIYTFSGEAYLGKDNQSLIGGASQIEVFPSEEQSMQDSGSAEIGYSAYIPILLVILIGIYIVLRSFRK
jgi:hypothetical protein